jgi:2,5-dioxopentanoate dehydrogenase
VELKGISMIGWTEGATGAAQFSAVNPAIGQEIAPKYSSASQAEVDRAANLASRAFDDYSHRSSKQRAAFLREIGKGIDAIIDDLISRMVAETGLTEARVRVEAARTSSQMRMFADLIEEGSWVAAHIDRGDPGRKPQPKPDLRSMWRPIGPVVVFGASNFPLAYSVAGGDTASALAAGNPVIVKAHPAHPGTGELVAQVIRKAARSCEMPEGVFSILFDAGMEIGAALVKHPRIRAVGFTGSQRGGRALMDLAAARPEPIPVYAEMGSTNPVFILPGAMKTRSGEIAAGLHSSVTLGGGQFCTKPGLVFARGSEETSNFAREVASRISASAPHPLLTPGIRAAYQGAVNSRERANRPALAATGTAPAAGLDVPATLFETDARTFLADDQLAAEVFGPSTLLVSTGSPDEMLQIARGLHGHLTATIHGTPEDLQENRELVAVLQTKVGRLLFNGFPTGVEVCSSMVHGGPYPATSDGRSTAVGAQAIHRFARLICFQNFPDVALPPELQNSNPLGIWRSLDGNWTRDSIFSAHAAG